MADHRNQTENRQPRRQEPDLGQKTAKMEKSSDEKLQHMEEGAERTEAPRQGSAPRPQQGRRPPKQQRGN